MSVEILTVRPSWFADAACRGYDVDLFFADRGVGANRDPYREARQVCAGCPVRDECLDYAIELGLRHGFWGGRTERQRRALRGQRDRRTLSASQRAHAARLHAAGLTAEEIGRQFGVTSRTVHRILAEEHA